MSASSSAPVRMALAIASLCKQERNDYQGTTGKSVELQRSPGVGFADLRNLGPQYSYVTNSPPALCTTASADLYAVLSIRL